MYSVEPFQQRVSRHQRRGPKFRPVPKETRTRPVQYFQTRTCTHAEPQRAGKGPTIVWQPLTRPGNTDPTGTEATADGCINKLPLIWKLKQNLASYLMFVFFRRIIRQHPSRLSVNMFPPLLITTARQIHLVALVLPSVQSEATSIIKT